MKEITETINSLIYLWGLNLDIPKMHFACNKYIKFSFHSFSLSLYQYQEIQKQENCSVMLIFAFRL